MLFTGGAGPEGPHAGPLRGRVARTAGGLGAVNLSPALIGRTRRWNFCSEHQWLVHGFSQSILLAYKNTHRYIKPNHVLFLNT